MSKTVGLEVIERVADDRSFSERAYVVDHLDRDNRQPDESASLQNLVEDVADALRDRSPRHDGSESSPRGAS